MTPYVVVVLFFIYVVGFTLLNTAFAVRNAHRESERRKRFPKRMIVDGEVMYEIGYDGVIVAAPRWELRIGADGTVTPLRRSIAALGEEP